MFFDFFKIIKFLINKKIIKGFSYYNYKAQFSTTEIQNWGYLWNRLDLGFLLDPSKRLQNYFHKGNIFKNLKKISKKMQILARALWRPTLQNIIGPDWAIEQICFLLHLKIPNRSKVTSKKRSKLKNTRVFVKK